MASYVVRQGDNLSSIAKKYNTSVSALAAANNISNPNLIYAGHNLTIPGSESVQPSPSSRSLSIPSGLTSGALAGGTMGTPMVGGMTSAKAPMSTNGTPVLPTDTRSLAPTPNVTGMVTGAQAGAQSSRPLATPTAQIPVGTTRALTSDSSTSGATRSLGSAGTGTANNSSSSGLTNPLGGQTPPLGTPSAPTGQSGVNSGSASNDQFNAVVAAMLKAAQGVGDEDLLAKRNALIQARFNAGRAATPEELRVLSPSAQASLRGIDDRGLNDQLEGVNTALQGRQNKRKTQQEAAQSLFNMLLQKRQLDQAESKPVEVNGQLVQKQADGSYKSVYNDPSGGAKTTNDIAEYNLAKSQGYTGTFLDFQGAQANLKQTNIPSSYREWELAGKPGTYAQWLKKGVSGITGLSDQQIRQIENSPEAKKLLSIQDLQSKLQTYKEFASQPGGFDTVGSRKAILDSLYADLKISYKEAANLGALTGPDVAIISEAIKPISGISNLAAYLSSGGQQGVLDSINQALTTAQRQAKINFDSINSKYGEFRDDPYIQNLGKGIGEQAASTNNNDPLDGALKQLGFNSASGGALNTAALAKVTQKYPEGSQGGQCGIFAHKIVEFPPIGDAKSEKFASVDKFGIPADQWRQSPRVGDVIVTSESSRYGHVAVVNKILPDGSLRLTESNFKGKESVSHDRILALNSPKIYGAFRGKLKV